MTIMMRSPATQNYLYGIIINHRIARKLCFSCGLLSYTHELSFFYI